ncbi:hypothetical protein C8R43DRAFT_1240614 [Mycena crocata]|nr:hypothetical protein C8R43DRAFT_1240614 [Mycena crocata]
MAGKISVTKTGDVPAQSELLEPGADAIPATAAPNKPEKHYRLVTIGKKVLPDPAGGGRKQSFWATVTAVGDNLDELERGMGEKTYETKTRGTRHDPPARLAARGCYALVNSAAQKVSDEKTYLGYSLSHPAPSDFGPVQIALVERGWSAIDFETVEYPTAIMDSVFGKGTRGRDPMGLRFAPCARPEMLDYVGTELLLVAVRGGEAGLENSLGEGRGNALTKTGEEDSEELDVRNIFQELWGGAEGIDLPDALDGEWI